MITRPKQHSPATGLAELRAFFEDDHVHLALIVAADGRLLTTVERSDLPPTDTCVPAERLGALAGRTVGPAEPLDDVTAALKRKGSRRLAVVDEAGRLLGLLCLKRDGTGYCTDAGVRARSHPTPLG